MTIEIDIVNNNIEVSVGNDGAVEVDVVNTNSVVVIEDNAIDVSLGRTGPQGPKGEKGDDGTATGSQNIPDWDSSTVYDAGASVFYRFESPNVNVPFNLGDRIWIAITGGLSAGTRPNLGTDWVTRGDIEYGDDADTSGVFGPDVPAIADIIGTAPTDDNPLSPRTGGTAAHQETTVVNRDTGVGYRSITDPNDSSSTVWIADHGLIIDNNDGLLIDADRAISVDHQRIITKWRDNIDYVTDDIVWLTTTINSETHLAIYIADDDNTDKDPSVGANSAFWSNRPPTPEELIEFEKRLHGVTVDTVDGQLIQDNDSNPLFIGTASDGSDAIRLNTLLDIATESELIAINRDLSTAINNTLHFQNADDTYETELVTAYDKDDILNVVERSDGFDVYINADTATDEPTRRGTTELMFSPDTTLTTSSVVFTGRYTGVLTLGSPNRYIYHIELNQSDAYSVDGVEVSVNQTDEISAIDYSSTPSLFNNIRRLHHHSDLQHQVLTYVSENVITSELIDGDNITTAYKGEIENSDDNFQSASIDDDGLITFTRAVSDDIENTNWCWWWSYYY